ncbi:MAG: hypothetical protein RJA05_473 [Planctomycetota bacterium]
MPPTQRLLPTLSLPARVRLALHMIATYRGAFLAGRLGQTGLSPREGAMYLAAVDVVRLYMIGEHDFADAFASAPPDDEPVERPSSGVRVNKRGPDPDGEGDAA